MNADTTTALAALTNRPARDDLIEDLAVQVRERLDHEHPKPGSGEDWFCLNLTGYMGERMGNVLTRLRDAEAERDRLRAVLDDLTVSVEHDLDSSACRERDAHQESLSPCQQRPPEHDEDCPACELHAALHPDANSTPS